MIFFIYTLCLSLSTHACDSAKTTRAHRPPLLAIGAASEEKNVQIEAARAVPPAIMGLAGVRGREGRPRPHAPLHRHCLRERRLLPDPEPLQILQGGPERGRQARLLPLDRAAASSQGTAPSRASPSSSSPSSVRRRRR